MRTSYYAFKHFLVHSTVSGMYNILSIALINFIPFKRSNLSEIRCNKF